MPIHNLGYRGWNWKRSSPHFRWLSIAEYGFQIALKSSWVRRLMLFAWLPILYWGAGIFLFEQIFTQQEQSIVIRSDRSQANQPSRTNRPDQGQNPSERRNSSRMSPSQRLSTAISQTLVFLPLSANLAERIATSEPDEFRDVFWTWLLMTFFRYPQSTTVVFILGFIAPSLIARDVRSRAFLLYFSRPIGRVDYMLGKLAIPAVFLALITALPALVLYLVGLAFSPDVWVVLSTWDIPVRVFLASLSLILPTASLAVMLSSMTQESRFASFAWFAIWALGFGAYLAIVLVRAATGNMELNQAMSDPWVIHWAPISIYNCLGQVQTWIFGFDSFRNSWSCVLTLVLITVVSLTLFYRNISKSVHS